MSWSAYHLASALCASLIACGGGKSAVAPRPKPVPSEAEDFCSVDTQAAHRTDQFGEVFGEFCRTRGLDAELERRMTETLVAGGADVRRFSVRCRADICSVKCVTVPREQCISELQNVAKWSAPRLILDGVAFQPGRGQALFKFMSTQHLARRELVRRIARRLHDSPALSSCKQNASAHGLLLLYIDVPLSGSPTVRVGGELVQTVDADCVSKALLATVIDEHVTPPLTNDDFPIAVNL